VTDNISAITSEAYELSAVLTAALVYGQLPFIYRLLEEMSFTHSSVFFEWIQTTWNQFVLLLLFYRLDPFFRNVSQCEEKYNVLQQLDAILRHIKVCRKLLHCGLTWQLHPSGRWESHFSDAVRQLAENVYESWIVCTLSIVST